jgi:hypothetical protein
MAALVASRCSIESSTLIEEFRIDTIISGTEGHLDDSAESVTASAAGCMEPVGGAVTTVEASASRPVDGDVTALVKDSSPRALQNVMMVHKIWYLSALIKFIPKSQIVTEVRYRVPIVYRISYIYSLIVPGTRVPSVAM